MGERHTKSLACMKIKQYKLRTRVIILAHFYKAIQNKKYICNRLARRY